MNKAKLFTIAAIALFIAFAGCTGAPQQASAPGYGSAQGGSLEAGKALYAAKACSACHGNSGEGVPNVGPALKGGYGKPQDLADGYSVTIDDAYLVESIKDADAKITKGFQKGTMTAAVPKGSLSDVEVNNLVAYIKTLK